MFSVIFEVEGKVKKIFHSHIDSIVEAREKFEETICIFDDVNDYDIAYAISTAYHPFEEGTIKIVLEEEFLHYGKDLIL